MKKNKIKFIASDLDGTLLLNGAQKVSEELIPLIKRLNDEGIIFCAASGRQYPNLRRLFGEVADELMYICENGSVIIYKDKLLDKTPMNVELGRDIIRTITGVEQCEVLVSGERTSYLKPKTESYLVRMRDIVRNDICLVDDLEHIEEDYVKISVYDPTGIENTQDYFLSAFEGRAQSCVSGKQWLDYTAQGVNKGSAIKTIQRLMGFEAEDCIAFGDNFNDIEMFQSVGYPIVMRQAVDAVKVHAAYETDRVENSLRKLIEKLQTEV